MEEMDAARVDGGSDSGVRAKNTSTDDGPSTSGEGLQRGFCHCGFASGQALEFSTASELLNARGVCAASHREVLRRLIPTKSGRCDRLPQLR